MHRWLFRFCRWIPGEKRWEVKPTVPLLKTNTVSVNNKPRGAHSNQKTKRKCSPPNWFLFCHDIDVYWWICRSRLLTKMATDIGMPEFFNVGSLVSCRTCSDKVSKIGAFSQCFVSIFIESESSQKSDSGSNTNFLTLSKKKIKLLHDYKIFSAKEVNWKIDPRML